MAVALLGAPPHHLSRIPEAWLAEPVRLEGRVAVPPDPSPAERRDAAEGEERVRAVVEILRLEIRGRWLPVTGRARLSFFGEPPELAYGRSFSGTFRLRQPRAFGNPAAFDYPAYLAGQGIFLEGWTREPPELKESEPDSLLLAALFRARGTILRRLDERLPSGQAALLKAMVLGDRSGLTPEMLQAFLGSGTYHILAISGLNVSLLAGVAFGLLRLGRVPARLAALCALLLVTAYAGLAGAGASVVRAAIMADVYLLAIVLDRRVSLLNSLALAALLLLWWSPRFLFEVGFQLTFLATLGIVLVVPACDRRLAPWPWGVRYVLASLVISLAATVMTAPVLASAFNRLTPAGLLANLPVVPLSGLVTALGLAAGGGLWLFPGGLPWLTEGSGVVAELLFRVAGWCAGWPGGSMTVYSPTLGMAAAYYTALALVWRAGGGGSVRARRAAAGLALLAALALVGQVAWRLESAGAREGVRATVLDVGQGEAILLELPGPSRLLLDAGGMLGGGFDTGRLVIAPHLWRSWIGGLDALVVSHADTDHLQGAAAILELFPVREVWTGPPVAGSVTGIWLAELVRRHRVPQRVLAADSPPGRFGPAVLEILHPPPGGLRESSRRPDANQASLVLRVRLGESAVLLTGDIGAEGEGVLLGSGRTLRAQVLKVPHHGSRTSSGEVFVRAVGPESAVFSVGHRNRFRHPHAEVLERYRRMGVEVWRTDRDGAIRIELTPEGIRLGAYRRSEPEASGPERQPTGRSLP
jgi:competence protein ComEC